MHVIQICPDLKKRDFVTCGYLKANILENLVHFCGHGLAPIFARANGMIQQKRDVMALVNVLAHLATIVADIHTASIREDRTALDSASGQTG